MKNRLQYPSPDALSGHIHVSDHASRRQQQRGINREDRLLIELFGDTILRPGGAVEIAFNRQALRRAIRRLERLKNTAILYGPEEKTVITTYHITR